MLCYAYVLYILCILAERIPTVLIADCVSRYSTRTNSVRRILRSRFDTMSRNRSEQLEHAIGN